MGKIIKVSDSFQKYSYKIAKKAGKNFHPDFKPELTPKQMLELGVFGANYFQGEYDELPRSWLENAKISKGGHNPELNYFGVDASQPLELWKKKGWIHPEDPRGWFQWYSRYYMGRRIEDDVRQIKRWKAIKRHIVQLKNACESGDYSCRPKQRQALLHWAYDSRKI